MKPKKPWSLKSTLLAALLAVSSSFAVASAFAQTNIDSAADAVEPRVIAWRRHIHQYPDLPFRSQAKAMWQGKETAVMHACGPFSL